MLSRGPNRARRRAHRSCRADTRSSSSRAGRGRCRRRSRAAARSRRCCARTGRPSSRSRRCTGSRRRGCCTSPRSHTRCPPRTRRRRRCTSHLQTQPPHAFVSLPTSYALFARSFIRRILFTFFLVYILGHSFNGSLGFCLFSDGASCPFLVFRSVRFVLWFMSILLAVFYIPLSDFLRLFMLFMSLSVFFPRIASIYEYFSS